MFHGKSKHRMLQPKEIKDLIDYDADAGTFTWKKTDLLKGIIAGRELAIISVGRVIVRGHHISARRLAWVCYFGEWPTGVLRTQTNMEDESRIRNIYMVTWSESRHTAEKHPHNPIAPGVHGRDGAYTSAIMVNYETSRLGTSDDPQRMSRLYKAAKKRIVAKLKKERVYPCLKSNSGRKTA